MAKTATNGRTKRGTAAEAIRRWFDNESFDPGETLPPEAEIAELLRISQPTVNRALRKMEREGLLSLRGRRRIVADPGTSRLARTVLVLASTGHTRGPTAQRSTGWEWHIIYNATSDIQRNRMNVLSVTPATLTPRELEGWLLDRPAGILCHALDMIDNGHEDLLEVLTASRIPTVLYGPADLFPDFDTVFPNQEQGAYQITKYLIDRGCRKPLRCWNAKWLPERDRGYERACREAGITPLPHLREDRAASPGDPMRKFELAKPLYTGYLLPFLNGETPVDGLLAPSDGDVPALSAAVREFNLIPQHDIKIVGYDNYWEDSWERKFEPTPPLATVDRRNPEVGRQLAEMLMQRIQDTLPKSPQHRVVEPEIVEFANLPLSAGAE